MKLLSCAVAVTIFASLGCGRGQRPIAATAAPDLEGRADQQAHSAAPAGERVGEALRGAAQENGYTDWRLQLEAGQCYWFGYAGDPGVAKFSMYIFSPKDSRLDSARGKAPEGLFTHCAEQNGIYRLQGKVAEGAGHYAVVIYKTKSATPVAPPSAPEEQKVDLAAMIEKQAAAAAPGAKRVGDLYASSAEQADWYTSVEPGKCYWFIGAGEPKKVKRLYLYLWDSKNKRVTESKSDSENVMVGHCAKEPGMFKFQAKIDSGKGDYKIGVYVK
jgi:hypothetical protein